MFLGELILSIRILEAISYVQVGKNHNSVHGGMQNFIYKGEILDKHTNMIY